MPRLHRWVSFEPVMQRERDLEWVASQDKVAPLSLDDGQFCDSMEAGYNCWRMSEGACRWAMPC